MPPSIPDHVFYPSSDGKRMAEDMWQFNAILNTYNDIKTVHPGALVAAALLVYPEEGNRDNSISPAVLVAFGIGTEKRWRYLVWKEGKPPDWVLEMASASISAGDREKRRNRYAAMGVPEYWLFDPKGDALPPGTLRLQAFGLLEGEYRPLESRMLDGKRMIHSKVLGLDVRGEDELLRFRDPATGLDIEHRPEVSAARKREATRANREAAARSAAEAYAAREAAARSAAEARVAELEAALKRLRADESP